jgi:DNA sulfur modification protein DndD
MLLRSIRTKNFRQYKGKQEITFSCDSERNVTVILGDNTSGKTTLVQAFNWALYGIASFPTKDLLNLDVSRQMHPDEKETVEVEICLNHDNTEYVISRCQEYACDNRGVRALPTGLAKVSYKKKDGQSDPIRSSAVSSTINKILPEELSSYFFFDGERITSISNKKDVTKSVKGLLGLSVLDNAKSHLNPSSTKSVIGKFKSGMDVGGNQKAEEAQKHIKSHTERRENIAKELAGVREQIEYYESCKEMTEEILRENQSTAALQRKRDDLERSKKQEDTALEFTLKRLLDDFNVNPIGFFAQPLMEKALACLREADISDKGIPNMNASSIDYIIKRGHCICGTEIKEESAAYNHLVRERDFLPPQSIGTMIRTFKEQISIYHSASESYYDNIKSRYEEVRRCKGRIQDWEDELLEIRSKIKGKDDVRKHEDNLRDYKARLRKFTSDKERLIQDDGALVNKIENAQKIYDSYAAVSDKNIKIRLYIRYAESIYNWVKKTYESSEGEIKEQLEIRVNRIFSQMYHGQRRVIINNQYNVTLLTAYDDGDVVTDESRGLETVKNFAFIAGLVDLAREKIKGKTGDLDMALSSEPYPLVMDAPFSNADEKHVCNISRVLPDIAEQVIMVIMAKDWGFAETVMAEKVGKKYYLVKKSETLTYIKEVV